MSSKRLLFHVYVDFDGTIVPKDATDRILEAYALPQWLEYEEAFQAGRITSRECMAKQVDLIRATPAQFDELIDGIGPDPDFARFVDLCRDHGAEISVLSDGMDRAVARVLGNAGIDIAYRANRLVWLGEDRWKLEYPYISDTCRVQAGNCKCTPHQQVQADAALHRALLVGDGRSDFCLAGRVDLVLAKARLLDHCKANDLPHLAFSDFAEAIDLAGRWFEGWRAERDPIMATTRPFERIERLRT